MSDRPDRQTAEEGLPPDLLALLRDPSIIVPQDAAVFKLIAEHMDAPSDTMSAMGVDEWRAAWSVTCRRMLAAQQERDALAARLVQVEAALRAIAHSTNLPHARRLDRDAMRAIARAALRGM